MTLSVRNNFLKGGIILAVLSLCAVGAGGYFTLEAFPGIAESAALRSRGIVHEFIAGYAESSAYVPYLSMLGAVVFSLISITLLYFFFEKTQSPEILFFAFFIISLSFEFTRIMIPLREVFPFPAMRLVIAARVLIFGRYLGLFSLFAAGAFAAGLDVQKQQIVFLMLVLAAMVIAVNIPVDNLAWDSTFKLLNGYMSMLNMVGAGILAVTIITFFISAYTRGSRTYVFIGIGTLLAFTGRTLLINSDNWITPLPGLLLLAAGTWLACSRLHKVYLWL